MGESKYKHFYEHVFWKESSISRERITKIDPILLHRFKKFVNNFNLYNKKVLEIGSGTGVFQDVVEDYTGIDVVAHLKKFYHKPFFVVGEKENYPFADDTFDAIFTHTVFEHIPDINKALKEALRVLKPGGVMFFEPAWQVRLWAAKGYAVRPYSDFDFKEKLIKAFIPLRDSVSFRLLYVVIKRILRTVRYVLRRDMFDQLEYKKLKPNYDKFWCSDSDACNHIDPHAAILWFYAHRCTVLNYPTLWRSFFVRSGVLIVQKLQ